MEDSFHAGDLSGVEGPDDAAFAIKPWGTLETYRVWFTGNMGVPLLHQANEDAAGFFGGGAPLGALQELLEVVGGGVFYSFVGPGDDVEGEDAETVGVFQAGAEDTVGT